MGLLNPQLAATFARWFYRCIDRLYQLWNPHSTPLWLYDLELGVFRDTPELLTSEFSASTSSLA